MRVVYLVSAFLGFATAAYYGIPFFASADAGFGNFVRFAFANPIAATLSSDLSVVYVASCVWIVHEGRRIGMGHLWLYILGSTCVAVAFGLGLFMFVRHSRLHTDASQRP